jgi:regulator of RNase E activity RraA
MPVFVWQLPTEGVVANDMTSENMNSWLRQAAKAAKIDLPVGLTAHCHRSGSATGAKKLQVDVAVFCQIADWDVGGKTFF